LKVDDRVGRQGRRQKVVILRHDGTDFQGVCKILCAALDDQESNLLKSLRECKVEHVSKCEVD
jgi:hypothetical protein